LVTDFPSTFSSFGNGSAKKSKLNAVELYVELRLDLRRALLGLAEISPFDSSGFEMAAEDVRSF